VSCGRDCSCRGTIRHVRTGGIIRSHFLDAVLIVLVALSHLSRRHIIDDDGATLRTTVCVFRQLAAFNVFIQDTASITLGDLLRSELPINALVQLIGGSHRCLDDEIPPWRFYLLPAFVCTLFD